MVHNAFCPKFGESVKAGKALRKKNIIIKYLYHVRKRTKFRQMHCISFS
jgi:hypothetical protein